MSAFCVVVMASAIATLTVAFATADAFLFRSVPFDAPEELVVFGCEPPRGSVYADAEFDDLRQRSNAFAAIAAGAVGPMAHLTGSTGEETVRAWQVTASLFSVLRVQPILGRLITEHVRCRRCGGRPAR